MKPLSQRYMNAMAYAARLHGSQFRKGGGAPYLTHLMTVSALVLEAGGDEDEAIAALLHDGPEDQGGSAVLREISQRFGPRVAEIVAQCSDSLDECKPDWWERKRDFVASLAEISASARLVICCDKLHNCRSVIQDHLLIGDAIWDRFHTGKEGSLWYYQAMLDGLSAVPEPPCALPWLEEAVARLKKL